MAKHSKAEAHARPQVSRAKPAQSRAADLDRLIHEPVRLGIVSALAVNETMSFNQLKELLKLTDGNLSVHARKLEDSQYIACDKYFEGRVPKTEYRLTAAGRRSLETYLDHMEALIRATRGIMKTKLETLALQTDEKQQLINITSQVREVVDRSGIQDGFVGLFSQHTTASLMVSEFQDALLDDIACFLRRVVEDNLPYKHNSPEFSDCDRRNAASHLRSMLFNNSVVLPVSGGELVLGQFQSVILAEMDGPRERSLKIQFLGE